MLASPLRSLARSHLSSAQSLQSRHKSISGPTQARQAQARSICHSLHLMSPSELALGKCEPCKKGSPRLSEEAIQIHYEELGGTQSGWRIEGVGADKEQALLKSYRFKNFRTALAFTNSVGALAEEQKHHPRLITEWGSVEVGWWTHAIGGLHTNDFVVAAKTDEIAKEAEGRKQ